MTNRGEQRDEAKAGVEMSDAAVDTVDMPDKYKDWMGTPGQTLWFKGGTMTPLIWLVGFSVIGGAVILKATTKENHSAIFPYLGASIFLAVILFVGIYLYSYFRKPDRLWSETHLEKMRWMDIVEAKEPSSLDGAIDAEATVLQNPSPPPQSAIKDDEIKGIKDGGSQ